MILKGKKVWITGASGAIGGAIVKRFQEEGGELYTNKIDITDYQAVDRIAYKIRPDILVNAAGICNKVPISDSFFSWADILNVNLIGSIFLTKSVIKKGVKIIHFSGGGAAYGRAFYSVYAASKAGLVRFVESVALERPDIQINAIAPGSVKSKMNPEGTETPDKAVELALYLASEESNHITGRLISAIHDDYRKPLSEEAGKLRRIPI